MDLEVRLGGERRPAGIAEDDLAKRESMRQALRTVAELTRAGLFSLRNEAVWRFELQFQSPADWTEFVDKPSCGGVEADQELLDAALSRPDGCVILTEEDLALVYEAGASRAVSEVETGRLHRG